MLVALLIATLAVAATRGSAVSASRREPGAAFHVVRPGDTLWEIARALVGPEGDPRPTVVAIRDANGLGSTVLLPGMKLALPR